MFLCFLKMSLWTPSNCVSITVGGNLINYPFELTTRTTDMVSSKLLGDSTISMKGARFADTNIKNMYLDTPLDRYEYMKKQEKGTGTKDTTAVIKITDDDNDISVLTSKMQDKLLALLVQERHKNKSAAGKRVASGSTPPISSLTANATPTGANGTAPVAAEGSTIRISTGTEGRVDDRPGSK
jgi:hypothetical protein